MIILNSGQLENLVEIYLARDSFAFDVETVGEHRGDPRRAKVFWISLATYGRADVIPMGHPKGELTKETYKYQEKYKDAAGKNRTRMVTVPPEFSPPPKQLDSADVFECLQPLFFSERRKIGQGVKFDLVAIAKYYKSCIPPPPYGDTIVAAHMLNENRPRLALDELVFQEFQYRYDKSLGKIGVEHYSFLDAATYSYLDAKYTWLLWRKFLAKLEGQGFIDG